MEEEATTEVWMKRLSGYIDEIIEPAVTRPKLIRAFEMLANKRVGNLPRKHGNIPL